MAGSGLCFETETEPTQREASKTVVMKTDDSNKMEFWLWMLKVEKWLPEDGAIDYKWTN